AARCPTASTGGGGGYGQAVGCGPDEWQCARGQLGTTTRQRRPRGLVSGRKRRAGDCRNPEREEQSRRTSAGYVLQVCRSASRVHGLCDGQSDLSLLQGRAAVRIWLWAELYDLCILQTAFVREYAESGRHADRRSGCQEYGDAGRR